MGCGEFAMGYLDNIIIFSKNKDDHLHHLEEIFSRLQHFGLKMKHEKCAFFKQHIQYLGHLISKVGFEPLPEKLESIRKMPAPNSTERSKTVPRPYRILLKICTMIFGHIKATHSSNMSRCQI